jgi:hypothetical protein
MQTYTHLLIGLGTAALAIDANTRMEFIVLAPIASGMGQIFPDVPSFIKMMLDIKNGEKPFSNQSKLFIRLKSIFHSIPISLLMLFSFFALSQIFKSSLSISIIGAFIVGLYTHDWIDIFTHSNKKYAKMDQNCLWPFPYVEINGWDYRKTEVGLAPKWPEAILDIVLLGYIAYKTSVILSFITP